MRPLKLFLTTSRPARFAETYIEKSDGVSDSARVIASAIAVIFGFALSWLLIEEHNFQKTNKAFDWTISKIGTQMLETNKEGFFFK